jgi:hypothetical protein
MSLDLYNYVHGNFTLRYSVDAAMNIIPLAPRTVELFRCEVLNDVGVALTVLRTFPGGGAPLPQKVLSDPRIIRTIFEAYPKWAQYVPNCDGRREVFKDPRFFEAMMENVRQERLPLHVLKHVPVLKPILYARDRLQRFSNFRALLVSRHVFSSFPTELQRLVGDFLGYVASKKWRTVLTGILALKAP